MRAVRSALAQTYKDVEVIVVIDGPDPATATALASIHDSRLRVIALPHAQGAQTARNTGIEAAQGDWVALLDDDDEWLPEKTELQLERAKASAAQYPIVSSKFLARTSDSELTWPRRDPYEPLSEYMLARDSCSRGEGWLHTITLLFPKDLFHFARFDPTLKKCQDTDWVLRASMLDGVRIEFISKPLAIWYDDDRARISTIPDWRTYFEWIESVRGLITPRAYASYLAITVASHAARQRIWSAFFFLLRRMLTRGAPKPRDVAFFLSVWCIPRRLQLAVRKAGL
jgi:glycosyltransferase involved in cell wall biosynthesis